MRPAAGLILGWCVAMGSAALAQSAAGPWQGTLQTPNNGPKLRIRIDVAGTDGALTGKAYSIDQSSSPTAIAGLAMAAGEMHFAVPALGASYTGKLSADGQTASGTFQQGGVAMPLELKHVTAEAAWPIPAAVQAARPMDPKADPSFEVATIKPTAPEAKGVMLTLQGNRLVIVNLALVDLLTFAYDVQAKQIVGAPAWASTDKFDITAVPDVPGQPSIPQLKAMIRKLVADRFAFQCKEDTREMAVYALLVAKTGPKMTQSVAPHALPGFFFHGVGKLTVSNGTMEEFGAFLQSSVVDRPVANQTGLKGRWDFPLNWTPDDSQFGGKLPPMPPPAQGTESAPSLYTALQEQAGLKLEPGKAPVRVLLVTGAAKPSPN